MIEDNKDKRIHVNPMRGSNCSYLLSSTDHSDAFIGFKRCELKIDDTNRALNEKDINHCI